MIDPKKRQGIHRNSCDRYTRFALEYASNNFSAPDRFLGIGEQQTIIIYDLLQDGEWHTAKEIGRELSLGKRTVQNIMQAISKPLSITNSHLGYCIIKKCLENDWQYTHMMYTSHSYNKKRDRPFPQSDPARH